MTPRHADVAYVLEGVAGVRAVLAVDGRSYDMAVAVEHGGGVLAEVHYALLRVLSYEEIQRVLVFHTDAPPSVKGRAITLSEMDRAAARARVPAPLERSPIIGWPGRNQHLRVLLVTDDRTIEKLVYAAFDSGAFCISQPDHAEAASLATRTDFDVILCDASRAFGLKGLLARLPLDRADRVIVVTERHDVEAARRRLQGDERILIKPVEMEALRQRVLHRPALTMRVAAFAIAANPFPHGPPRVLAVTDDASLEHLVRSALDEPMVYAQHGQVAAAVARNVHFAAHFILCEARLLNDLPEPLRWKAIVIGGESGQRRSIARPFDMSAVRAAFADGFADIPRRRCVEPAAGAPFTAVLVDVPEDVAEALRRVLPIDSRHLSRTGPEAAAELLLSSPFHVAFVSAKAALASSSVLSLVAREDRKGSERIIVVAPARDVPYVKHSLARDGHPKQRVIALPLDDATLQRELHRDHPEIATRVAIAESDPFPTTPTSKGRMRVLIVDDDITTQMLRGVAPREHNVDFALATTAVAAFELVVSTSVSVLVVSASMRSDGGEPMYRVLWRLVPELKGRTVLITNPDMSAPPMSVSNAHPRRIVSRPLTAQVVGRIVEMYRDT